MTNDTDAALGQILARFAAVAAVALDDPGVWLGRGGELPAVLPVAVLRRIRRLATGSVHPGAPGWEQLPVERRDAWWVHRIQTVAAPVAATPRIFGVFADRLPLQGAFGTAVAGLAVCAVAREHGLRDPAAWVPLLGRVLFDRDLARPEPAQLVLPDEPARPSEPAPSDTPARAGVVRRTGGALWRLASIAWEAQSLFDERPRGLWLWRAIGKVPVVGFTAGVLDESGAVARAARAAARLAEARPRAAAS